MSIKLDDLDLSAVKGQLSMGLRSQTSSVTRIGTIDRRRIIKHDASAVYGTIVDDQGKASARLLIEGRFVGDDAMTGMSSLRTKYKKGEPINLVSDITLLSSINKVMIEELRIQMSSSGQLSYEYQMILREYVETVKKQSAIAPPQKAQALGSSWLTGGRCFARTKTGCIGSVAESSISTRRCLTVGRCFARTKTGCIGSVAESSISGRSRCTSCRSI